MFKHWFALPTWALTHLLNPFLPMNHAWKGRLFTLTEWAEGETELCKDFDAMGWMSLCNVAFIIWFLYNRW